MHGPELGLGAVGQAPLLGLALTRAHEDTGPSPELLVNWSRKEARPTESGVLAGPGGEGVEAPGSLEMGQP